MLDGLLFHGLKNNNLVIWISMIIHLLSKVIECNSFFKLNYSKEKYKI